MSAPSGPSQEQPVREAASRPRWGRLVTYGFSGLMLAAFFVPPSGPVFRVLLDISLGAFGTLVRTWAVDGPATLLNILGVVARVVLCVAPTVALFLHLKRGRVFVALWSLVFVGVVPFSLRSCPTPWHWAAGIALAVAGCLMVRRWYLRWGVALPMIVTIVVPALDHGSNSYWTPERLAVRCAANDGERPVNVRSDQMASAYYGLHPYADDLWLLTGESGSDGQQPFGLLAGGTDRAGSWWIRRNAEGRLEIESHSRASGNLWNACKLGDVLWALRANFVIGIQRDASGRERVEPHRVEMRGFDAAGLLCDPSTNSLFFMEGMYGQIWEMSVATLQPRPRAGTLSRNVGGFLIRRESDGRFVYMNPYQIGVYDPRTSSIVHSLPASLAAINIDLCQQDGAVVEADFAGRVRLFTMEETGGYRFGWGTSLFAPRRVRFSPDCSHIAVTSSNDRDVWLLDRATHQVVRTWSLGPSIRGLAFTGPRELAVVDACTVSTLRY